MNAISPGGCKGGTYFFNVNLTERKRTLLVEHADVIRFVLREVKARHPFHIDAMVILPDHPHAVRTLPPGDCDYPTRWMLIKMGFSRRIPARERRNKSRMTKGERGIWQLRYWEHMIHDERDYHGHVDYVHWNPVKHGYASRVIDWPYSALRRYVARGMYPSDWGGDGRVDDHENFGV